MFVPCIMNSQHKKSLRLTNCVVSDVFAACFFFFFYFMKRLVNTNDLQIFI